MQPSPWRETMSPWVPRAIVSMAAAPPLPVARHWRVHRLAVGSTLGVAVATTPQPAPGLDEVEREPP